MNKYAETVVIEFKAGITVDTFTKDEDFRSGVITRELAGKTRIVWDNDSSVEWVNSDKVEKLDSRHKQLNRA